MMTNELQRGAELLYGHDVDVCSACCMNGEFSWMGLMQWYKGICTLGIMSFSVFGLDSK